MKRKLIGSILFAMLIVSPLLSVAGGSFEIRIPTGSKAKVAEPVVTDKYVVATITAFSPFGTERYNLGASFNATPVDACPVDSVLIDPSQTAIITAGAVTSGSSNRSTYFHLDSTSEANLSPSKVNSQSTGLGLISTYCFKVEEGQALSPNTSMNSGISYNRTSYGSSRNGVYRTFSIGDKTYGIVAMSGNSYRRYLPSGSSTYRYMRGVTAVTFLIPDVSVGETKSFSMPLHYTTSTSKFIGEYSLSFTF